MKKIIIRSSIVILILLITFGMLTKHTPPETALNYNETMFITPKTGYTPLEYAFTFLGEKEKFTDGTSNPIVLSFYKGFADWVNDSEVPWCSAFINSIYASTGYEYSGNLSARSWLKVGKTITDPKPGDLVIFWRNSPSSWEGHVGIYLNHTTDGRYVVTFGGNQSNMVGISNYSNARVLGYRRPNKNKSSVTFQDTTSSIIELKLNGRDN